MSREKQILSSYRWNCKRIRLVMVALCVKVTSFLDLIKTIIIAIVCLRSVY